MTEDNTEKLSPDQNTVIPKNSQNTRKRMRPTSKSSDKKQPTNSPRRKRRYTGRSANSPLSPQDREKAKALFLASMKQRNVIGAACRAAGITHGAYQYWLNTGYLTPDDLQEAYSEFQDRLRDIAVDIAVEGIDRPLANNGHLVLDQYGQPIMTNTKDTRMFAKMLEKHLPEYAEQARQVDITLNAQQAERTSYHVTIDTRLLTPQEYSTLRRLAKAIERRELGTPGTMGVMSLVDSGIVESTTTESGYGVPCYPVCLPYTYTKNRVPKML
jgi:hypothetical protein